MHQNAPFRRRTCQNFSGDRPNPHWGGIPTPQTQPPSAPSFGALDPPDHIYGYEAESIASHNRTELELWDQSLMKIFLLFTHCQLHYDYERF